MFMNGENEISESRGKLNGESVSRPWIWSLRDGVAQGRFTHVLISQDTGALLSARAIRFILIDGQTRGQPGKVAADSLSEGLIAEERALAAALFAYPGTVVRTIGSGVVGKCSTHDGGLI
jgi:hypothetical protein